MFFIRLFLVLKPALQNLIVAFESYQVLKKCPFGDGSIVNQRSQAFGLGFVHPNLSLFCYVVLLVLMPHSALLTNPLLVHSYDSDTRSHSLPWKVSTPRTVTV